MFKIEDWMTKDYGLDRVLGGTHLLVRRKGKRIALLVAKDTDDFLIRRSERDVKKFTGILS